MNVEPGQPVYIRFLIDAVTVRASGFVTVALERLNPPRIDLPEERLFGVTVADALRWVKRSRPNRQSRISA